MLGSWVHDLWETDSLNVLVVKQSLVDLGATFFHMIYK